MHPSCHFVMHAVEPFELVQLARTWYYLISSENFKLIILMLFADFDFRYCKFGSMFESLKIKRAGIEVRVFLLEEIELSECLIAKE